MDGDRHDNLSFDKLFGKRYGREGNLFTIYFHSIDMDACCFSRHFLGMC